MPTPEELQSLREALGGVDRELLVLVARRQALAGRIGELKASLGRPTRDFTQEKEVLDRARKTAESLGLPGEIAADLLRLLISSSLTRQERDRLAAAAGGVGRRALVIGGSGRMGGWLLRFLSSQGFGLEIADPAAGPPDVPRIADWEESPLDHDLIVVAATLTASATILHGLAARKPKGLVFDVGSLKGPLIPALDALRTAGVKVTSIHPMFGPNTELLSGRHVIFIDCGVPEAVAAARELFSPTMALQVTMTAAEHDRHIAYVLGLSHALNLIFSAVLAESGEAAPALASMSSTTFDAQLAVARQVSSENPRLYFEIQHLNQYGLEPLRALKAAASEVLESVKQGDEVAFATLMQRGRDYFTGRGGEAG